MSELKLRPYQEETIAAAIQPKAGIWRRLLVLATGAGKTVISAEILNRVLGPGKRALFLAHRDELLKQAKAEIEGFVPDLHVELEQAENRATRESGLFDVERRHVVVGSVQTLRNKRLKGWSPDTFDIVIIDEAHHGAAKSYQDIVEHFGCMDSEKRTPLIGVTATPMRSDNVGLDVAFQEISANHNIHDLVEQGYLCDLRAVSVNTEIDLREVKTTAGDYNAKQLQSVVDDEERNALIVASHRKYAADRPTIVFAAGVSHAQNLADLFVASGVSAEAMYGAMDDDSRRDTLARYASGETQVLTHYNILTEGFNAPQTSCIILGRPTKSSLIICQAIGRGTRLHPGKEDCLVIDVRDVTNGKNLFSAASLAGLPSGFDLKGKNMFTVAAKHRELKELSVTLAAKSMTPEDIEKNIELATNMMRAREVDLLAREIPPYSPAPQRPKDAYTSPFLWYRAGETAYELSIGFSDGISYRVFQQENGTWRFAARESKDSPWVAHPSSLHSDVWQAIKVVDSIISSSPMNTTLIRKDASWAKDHPSPKQIALLAKFHIDHRGLSKGQATQKINSEFARRAKATPTIFEVGGIAA